MEMVSGFAEQDSLLEMGEHLSAYGKHGTNSLFCLFVCMAFVFSFKLSSFYPSDSPPTPAGGAVSEWLHGAFLVGGIKLQPLDISYPSLFSVEEYQ